MGTGRFIWYFVLLKVAHGSIFGKVIEPCLRQILNTYFGNESFLLVTDFTLHGNKSKPSLLPDLEAEHNKELIIHIMKEQKRTIQIYNSYRYLGLPAHLKLKKLKNSIILFREDMLVSEDLFENELDSLNRNPLWNPAGRNLIMLKVKDSVYSNKFLSRKIIKNIWTKSKAVNNLVMIVGKKGTIKFYTWFPYKQPYCSEVEVIHHLDTYKKGRFRFGRNLFPPKVDKNLQGCEILAATDTCIPYVFSDPDNATEFTGGLEYLIVESFTQQLNFKLRTVRPPNMWATKVNGTISGAFKLLSEQKVDMAFSCLMLNTERNILALALPPYYVDALTWFVPSPGFKSHATDIFFSLPYDFWLLMVITLAASTVPFILLTRKEFISKKIDFEFVTKNFLSLISMSLYEPMEFPHKGFTLRIFIFIFFTYSMHVTIAFQSSLFSLYRTPRYDKFYNTLEEAVDDGLFFYLRPSTHDLYNQSDHELWNKILAPHRFDYLQDFGKAFDEIAYDKKAIALFIRSTGIYMVSVYYTDEYGVPQVLWLKENFASYPVATFLSPSHPLFDFLNIRVFRLVASGLVRIWMRRSVVGGKLVWFTETFINTPLSLKHLAGAFFLIVLLLTLSILVFLLEIMIFCILQKRQEAKNAFLKKRRDFYPYRIPKSKKSSHLGTFTLVREQENIFFH